MTQWFFMLLIAGLMLIGAEVFIPGGVLGVAGAGALFVAAAIGFAIFPAGTALVIAISMIVMVGAVIALWIKIFPHTGIGKQMTAQRDLKDAKGTEDKLSDLIGKTGITRSALHPSGYAEIDGRRIDVITQGEMIDSNTTVRITDVEGNRVIVEAVSTPDASATADA
jgi:membrane-bound serine protease (ClpP class)